MPSQTTSPAILINLFSVQPSDQAGLAALLKESTEAVIETLDGWIATEIVASADGQQVVIYSHWKSAEAIEAMRADERMRAYFPRIAGMASLTSIVGDLVLKRHY